MKKHGFKPNHKLSSAPKKVDYASTPVDRNANQFGADVLPHSAVPQPGDPSTQLGANDQPQQGTPL